MEVRDPPELVPNGDPTRNGEMCKYHTIYYVLTTSAAPGNHPFGIVFSPKSGEKQGSAQTSTKVHSKVTPATAKWR